MNKKQSLKATGIILCLFIALFFVPTTQCFAVSISSIEFAVDESLEDAKYIQCKIKASKEYGISIQLKGEDGESWTINFETNQSEGDYNTSPDRRLEVGIGSDYADGDIEIYESESFYDLISLHISENNDSEFYSPETATIKMITIYGTDFNLYSITLADNDNFDDPCWEKDASDWNNLNDFQADDGSIPAGSSQHTNVRFYSQYVNVYYRSYASQSYNPYSYQQAYNPYGYGYQQSYNPYSYQQSYNPYSYQQSYNPYGYGYQQSYDPYSYQQAYNPYGSGYGYQQPYNPYSYQQAYNPFGYGYQQPYNTYVGHADYFSPEDTAILAAGGLPSWAEIPDFETWKPYLRPYY